MCRKIPEPRLRPKFLLLVEYPNPEDHKKKTSSAELYSIQSERETSLTTINWKEQETGQVEKQNKTCKHLNSEAYTTVFIERYIHPNPESTLLNL